MGYFIESFTELHADGAWMDMGMYIGAGSSMPDGIRSLHRLC